MGKMKAVKYQKGQETGICRDKRYAGTIWNKVFTHGNEDIQATMKNSGREQHWDQIYKFLADNLLDMGYQDITVLDISEEALNRAKQRLGERAKKVKWILTDVTKFKPKNAAE